MGEGFGNAIMILTIDIGNTSTHFGVFKGERIIREWRIETERLSGYKGIRKWISGYQGIKKVMVSSVVPRASKVIRKLFPKAIFVNYKNIGIKIRVKRASEVGPDRLVDALAAYILYKGPCVVVDFGTATTFDVVSARGEYLGGAIAPGIMLARDALYEQTAKLPRITIRPPRSAVGRDTVEAMRSGLVYGYVAMVEGMIRRIKKELTPALSKRGGQGVSCKVIATGGLAKLICKYTDVVDRIEPKLTLKGLNYVGRAE
jgi:type III pantothenate kinase